MVGTILVAAIYLIVSTVPLLLIPEGELADASAPFALLMERFGQAGSGRWLALFVVVSGLGALNGWTLLVGELTRTMAVNGVLPAAFARNNRHGAPMIALLVTGALASLMIGMSYSQSLVAAFTFITRVVTAANLPLYLACALALWVLAWRGNVGTGVTGSAKGNPRAALVSAGIGALYVIFALVGIGGEPSLYALGLIAAGLPLYAIMRAQRKIADPLKV